MRNIKDKFYQEYDKLCNSDDNIYLNFLSVITLNTIYKSIVGDNLFDIDEFKNNYLDKYNYILGVEYEKSNYIKKIVRYNLEQMKDSNILYDASRLLSSYIIDSEGKDDTINFVKLDDEFKDKLIIDFLDSEDVAYKNIYLKLKEENRIFFLDDVFDNYNGITYINPKIDNKNDCFIFINKFYDDFYSLVVLIHEIGHLREYLDLKDILTEEEFVEYQLTSPYIEVNAMTFSLKFIKYLENLGLPEEEIRCLRSQELTLSSNNINKLVLGSSENVNELDLFYKLRYTYGGLISMFFDSIGDRSILDKKENIFFKEKILNNDIEILDKIGCNRKKESWAVKKYIKKCL